ncbi:ubiquitin-conjugating enzyme E2C [Naegleria gruberi]|uniref:Ubiquitin-conjugating enzyme E2C n=1 Tax=Naegleria gruberi TaxID=5762 RepID=D2V2G4_NAEGR|nr:ubiquitin-conjugating enzyme E2C [Naegleria gruberi]EFC48893.1 ubiquitin-conjugating enzyme E2C [Naegleria gruberi]|eukprot:XP_002681637.1 ubiquitin-conjugating enzyme E2C [Naegleria gruberi strain NEG-M]
MSSSAIVTSPSKAASKQAPSNAQSTTKRLQSELMNLMMSKTAGITAFPEEGNMLKWTGTLKGCEGTCYDGQSYKLSLSFSNDYPFKVPVVKFITPIYHPNVDQFGNICLDILKDKWSATYNVRTILISIQSLMNDPNIEDPLNGEAAQNYADPVEFKRLVDLTYQKKQ